jgi:hypothetical protein
LVENDRVRIKIQDGKTQEAREDGKGRSGGNVAELLQGDGLGRV